MIVAAGLALALPQATSVMAEQPPARVAEAEIDAKAVVTEVRQILAERYVLPERRPALDAVLAQGLASGRYDVKEPALLAERIDADLAAAGKDKHLGFSFDPARAEMLRSPGNDAPPDQAAWRKVAHAANHGISELRVLPGNIRYMKYDGFMWAGPESAAALDDAMRFLRGGDVAIIDIRRNGGGSPQAVQYIVSHFLPPDRPLVAFHMGGEPEPDRLSTLAQLPAGRMIGKPLYVLTSAGSASAAEEFAGHVSGFHLGELVGETTAGAAFRNDLAPIAGGFVLSVSVGRPVLASTGDDWEAEGIAPTIPSEVEDALEVAQQHALRQLAATAPEPDRERLGALAEAIGARLRPVAPALPLASYAGRFGERTVTAEDGRLYYQRAERPRSLLIPLGGHRFALDSDPATQLEFHIADEQVTGFDLGEAGGPPRGRHERTG